MDQFESRLKLLPLRTPSESFGQEQTLAALLEADRAESRWRRKKKSFDLEIDRCGVAWNRRCCARRVHSAFLPRRSIP